MPPLTRDLRLDSRRWNIASKGTYSILDMTSGNVILKQQIDNVVSSVIFSCLCACVVQLLLKREMKTQGHIRTVNGFKM